MTRQEKINFLVDQIQKVEALKAHARTLNQSSYHANEQWDRIDRMAKNIISFMKENKITFSDLAEPGAIGGLTC